MTHREIAERLRKAIADEFDPYAVIESLANELDPPRPEPGTVVRWRKPKWDSDKWLNGVITEMGDSVIAEDGFRNLLENIEWKPARILADHEVAVKVPPVSEWPKRFGVHGKQEADSMNCSYEYTNSDGEVEDRVDSFLIITRSEAEKMEANQ